jgi:hypothetical protein
MAWRDKTRRATLCFCSRPIDFSEEDHGDAGGMKLFCAKA